jgi:hypothetical protein
MIIGEMMSIYPLLVMLNEYMTILKEQFVG